uniref:Uncharacterized protein n=1 Tax=Arundo donax TaxID=35708 RepID=A0A0A9FB08_ARUDO
MERRIPSRFFRISSRRLLQERPSKPSQNSPKEFPKETATPLLPSPRATNQSRTGEAKSQLSTCCLGEGLGRR